jgi:hypothetical protein
VKAVVLVRWHWRDGGWHGHEPSGVVEMEAVERVQRRRVAGLARLTIIQTIFKFLLTLKFKIEAFPYLKNIQTLNEGRSKYFEQLSQLA